VPTSLLLHAFARRDAPLTFSELAGALEGTGAMVSELAAALAVALSERTVVACGFAAGDGGSFGLGPRLLVLSERGWKAVAADRL
jgi:DNA-binding IclR family transcriptional regulator